MGHKFDPIVEDMVTRQVYQTEYTQALSDQNTENNDFEAYVDLFDSVRSEKDYDWMSDISIPEFASHELTQAALDAAQYFQTRDFVETYIQDESDEALASADAASRCVNRTLNQRGLYHYLKFMRSRMVNNLGGKVYLQCWWEQSRKRVKTGVRETQVPLDVDHLGNPFTGADGQVQATRTDFEDVYQDMTTVDRFMYDVLDPRNVFTDRKYCYSLQQKDWVIVRSDSSLQKLKENQEVMGYFNLDLVGQRQPDVTTETQTYTLQRDVPQATIGVSAKGAKVYESYDILQRYGKMWCTVLRRDEKTGFPIEIEPGYDRSGNPLPNAEFLEVIMAVASSSSSRTLIRFHANGYLDAMEQPFRPIIRGLCYVHPTKDGGIGDGKYSRDLQKGLDDTLNLSNDRVMLSTLPTLKGKKYSIEDNSSIYFEPMHVIGLENVEDLQEFKFSSDINGALAQAGMFMTKMQQVNSVYPPAMGQTPAIASTTATATADASQHVNIRSNFKALTFENTALSELYWMILQMTFRFATPETGMKLMGERLRDFNPRLEYFYKPLSQSIEPEQSKRNKIMNLDSILQKVIAVKHPGSTRLFNYLFSRTMFYMGDEYSNFKKYLLDESIPIEPAGGPSPPAGQGMMPPSNQMGVPQSSTEQGVRGG
jgi:hypothetical protein